MRPKARHCEYRSTHSYICRPLHVLNRSLRDLAAESYPGRKSPVLTQKLKLARILPKKNTSGLRPASALTCL
jgi:hypothetical protein